MKRINRFLFIPLLLFALTSSFSQVSWTLKFDTPYGNNTSIGKYLEIDGAKIYYEEYGSGDPLLLIHGNGASIKYMGHQIEYFKKSYRVIVADNRGHGKSDLKTDSLTFVQIAKDWEILAQYLELDSTHIIGWSDGGIVALLIASGNNIKLNKIVAMGANMRPDSTAVYPFAVNYANKKKQEAELKITNKDDSKNWDLVKQKMGLLTDQPSISTDALSKIVVPVLIIAGDKDIIKEEHTVELFQNIPHAHLCILPGETHFAPLSSPESFNAAVTTFLDEPFKRVNSDFTKW